MHGIKPVPRDAFDSFPCSELVRHFNPGSTSLVLTESLGKIQIFQLEFSIARIDHKQGAEKSSMV